MDKGKCKNSTWHYWGISCDLKNEPCPYKSDDCDECDDYEEKE